MVLLGKSDSDSDPLVTSDFASIQDIVSALQPENWPAGLVGKLPAPLQKQLPKIFLFGYDLPVQKQGTDEQSHSQAVDALVMPHDTSSAPACLQIGYNDERKSDNRTFFVTIEEAGLEYRRLPSSGTALEIYYMAFQDDNMERMRSFTSDFVRKHGLSPTTSTSSWQHLCFQATQKNGP